MPYFLQTGATSNRAENYGTPLPATILVIQIDPFPIPHRIPSAPDLISCSAPSPVAILPATISIPLNYSFNILTASMQSQLCPLATSTTSTSTSDLINSLALSRQSLLAPIAAPTNNFPWKSMLAYLRLLFLKISFLVTNAIIQFLEFTIGSFSTLFSTIILRISSQEGICLSENQLSSIYRTISLSLDVICSFTV